MDDTQDVQRLAEALGQLESTEIGRPITQAIRDRGTTIKFGMTDKDAIAQFDPATNGITISASQKDASPAVLAAYLAHEGTHVGWDKVYRDSSFEEFAEDYVDNYVRFSSHNPRLNFTFLYPGAWQARETKGRETIYDEVFILGPRNREDTHSLALIVRVTPLSGQGEQYANVETWVADYLAKNRCSAQFREMLHAYGSLVDCDATEIEISYAIPLPIYTAHPKETRIVERRIFFQRTGYLYEMIYSAVEEDYYKYLDVFKDAVHTFEFTEETVRQDYRPLIVPAPAHVLAESRGDYRTKE